MFRRVALVLAMALTPFGLLQACSDPPAKPGPSSGGRVSPPPGGGGGVDGGEGGTLDGSVDADAAVCNDVPLTGMLIDRVGISGDPPVATGGTIPDAIYDLTDYSVYVGVGGVAGPTGITAKASLRVAGGKLDEVIELGGSGKTASTKRTSNAFTATGATIAMSSTCPLNAGGKQLQFTANGLTLVLTDLTSKEAFTFTKH